MPHSTASCVVFMCVALLRKTVFLRGGLFDLKRFPVFFYVKPWFWIQSKPFPMMMWQRASKGQGATAVILVLESLLHLHRGNRQPDTWMPGDEGMVRARFQSGSSSSYCSGVP